MKIGSLSIDPPVVLAPMAGITDWPMRLLCRRYGAPLCFTEMVPAAAIARGRMPTDVIRSLKTHPDDRPLGVQIFGPDPDEMATAARELAAFDADLIDINMGCPVRKVVKNGAGCALMQDLDRARRIVASVRAAVDAPLTVKMRLGWDEASQNAVELARICEGEGADAVTVHGRTRARVFSGEADLAGIREVVEALSIPVIGNGGVMDAAGYGRMLEETGCAGVMVARGAMGSPWVFAEIIEGADSARANPGIAERGEVALDHMKLMLSYLPERRVAVEMRKFLAWYSKGIPRAVDLRRRLQKIETKEEVVALVEEFFGGEESSSQ